jgi:predicted PurR-regulated permease PerM
LKIKRGIAIAMIYVILLMILGGFSWLVIPLVIDNATQIISDAPRLITKANSQISESGILSDPSIQEGLASIRGKIVEWANLLLLNLAQILGGITSAVFNMVIGFVVSIYTLIDKNRLQAMSGRVLRALFKESRADAIFDWLKKIHNIFSKFLTGLIVEAIFVGILAFIGLTILGIKYAPIFGLVIGLTNVIPYVGPFIGAIPAVGITLLYSPLSALKVAVLIIVVQQIDANLIGPRIMGNYIGLRPIWIILAISVGGTFGGMTGMILSIPVAAIMKLLFEHYIEKKEKEQAGTQAGSVGKTPDVGLPDEPS